MMAASGCYIGRARLKAHPNISVLPKKVRGLDAATEQELRTMLEEILDYCRTDGIGGVVIVGWDLNGFFNRGIRVHKDSFIGMNMLAPFVAEVLRKSSTEKICNDILDERMRF